MSSGRLHPPAALRLISEPLARRRLPSDFLVGDNDARSTAESLDAYFLPFAVASREKQASSGGTATTT
jgi:hypothetical protein